MTRTLGALASLIMLLAEDLLLLLTDDTTGRLLVTGVEADIALAGALLVELGLGGRLDLDDRHRLRVLDDSPTGDELLDATLEIGCRLPGRRPAAVMHRFPGRRKALHQRLAAAGYVRAERGRVLGVFPRTTWPASSTDHQDRLRRALALALVDGAVPDSRTGSLVALLHALRATHKVLDPNRLGTTRKDLDRRAVEIAAGCWGAVAVRKAIDVMMAA